MNSFSLGGRLVGDGAPCVIIAEAGCNHGGRREDAVALVRAAAQSGADYVKFQTFRAQALLRREGNPELYGLLEGLELDADAHGELLRVAREAGVDFLSTPFDEASLELLASLDPSAVKIGSFELTHTPLLAAAARLGKPLLISTGMATLGEVEQALDVVLAQGNDRIVLLHCASTYPSVAADLNLAAMETLRRAFGFPVGLSDHYPGIESALAAVALGAAVVEKHVTLDRNQPGLDHAFSLEPHQFRAMVQGIRQVEAMRGDGQKRPRQREQAVRQSGRRILVASRDLPVGTVLSAADLACKRPGVAAPETALPASALSQVLGRRTRDPMPRDAVVTCAALMHGDADSGRGGEEFQD
ncbi:MAG: N-acetylneuraminate synthase family protein [Magnetococcus sp. WYHC-3]